MRSYLTLITPGMKGLAPSTARQVQHSCSVPDISPDISPAHPITPYVKDSPYAHLPMIQRRQENVGEECFKRLPEPTYHCYCTAIHHCRDYLC